MPRLEHAFLPGAAQGLLSCPVHLATKHIPFLNPTRAAAAAALIVVPAAPAAGATGCSGEAS
jgi:hypothetical protein